MTNIMDSEHYLLRFFQLWTKDHLLELFFIYLIFKRCPSRHDVDQVTHYPHIDGHAVCDDCVDSCKQVLLGEMHTN